MQVGAHHARTLGPGSPPPQTRVAAQGLKTGIRGGGAVVQFKSAQGCFPGPEAIDAALAQPFRAAEGGVQGQEAQAALGAPLIGALQSLRVVQRFAQHLHAAADAQDGPPSLGVGPELIGQSRACLLYTSPSPRDRQKSRMPSSA